ncbi:hypothetical protein D3C87_2112680 [compost metagenome]
MSGSEQIARVDAQCLLGMMLVAIEKPAEATYRFRFGIEAIEVEDCFEQVIV